MKTNVRIVGRFRGYTVKDCACAFCLHYAGKNKPCPLKRCCCAEERAAAMAREQRQQAQVPQNH